MTKHLTREELVAIARNYVAGSIPDHIGECPDCRDDLQMLVRYCVAGKLSLAEPPNAWVKRAKELAANTSLVATIRKALAKLAFDSWAQPAPVGVRGGATTEQRRMRFESGPVVVDLRAERQKSGWSFVAQVSEDARDRARLQADKQSLPLDEFGICQWSNEKPPKKIAIVTRTRTIELPGLTWKSKLPKRPPTDS